MFPCACARVQGLYVEDLSAAVEVQLPGSETIVQYTVVMVRTTLLQAQTAPAECLLAQTAAECLGAVQTPPLPPPPQVLLLLLLPPLLLLLLPLLVAAAAAACCDRASGTAGWCM